MTAPTRHHDVAGLPRGLRAVACICGADEPCAGRCDKHDRDLHGWPCAVCEREWSDTHPHTSALIAAIAAGKGSPSKLAAARAADATLTTEPTP